MIIASRFGGQLLSGLRPQKPLDETRQSLIQRGGWPVIEKFSRFRNVRARQGHVAGLFRQLVDFRLFPQRLFDCKDQVFELDRLALTKVKDIEERAFVLECCDRSLNYVIDVSVITSRCAVAELLDWLPGINPPSELMNCQIGSLPRTIHREVAQRDDAQPVKV
jgi:hypothetical protein